ncbi:hypothetical protein [Burkholderia anthina]|uniref:hypothetical protein n=1 Tax=Burkholderia anthina TaxID=179879 RepID=UPI0037C1966C
MNAIARNAHHIAALVIALLLGTLIFNTTGDTQRAIVDVLALGVISGMVLANVFYTPILRTLKRFGMV